MRLVAAALAVLLTAATAPAGAPTPRKSRWSVDKPEGRVVLRLKSDPIDYGAFTETLTLTLTCSVADQRLQAYVASDAKTMGTFIVRFDSEAVAEHGSPGDRFHDPVERHQLRVADDKASDFVRDVRTHRRMLLRHEFGGRSYDGTFDLTGLASVIGPFQQACALSEAAPPAPQEAAAAKGPKETRLGNWVVTETLSKLDDKPRIIMTAADKLGNLNLVFRCQERMLEAYVYSGAILDSDRSTQRTTLTVAIDGGEPAEYKEPASGSQAVFLPDTPALVKALSNRRTMTVTYTPYNPRRTMATKTATIDVAGFDKALATLATACPIE